VKVLAEPHMTGNRIFNPPHGNSRSRRQIFNTFVSDMYNENTQRDVLKANLEHFYIHDKLDIIEEFSKWLTKEFLLGAKTEFDFYHNLKPTEDQAKLYE